MSYDKGCLVIDLPNNIKGSLANLIIVKTLTTVGYEGTSFKDDELSFPVEN